jgi:hypothetical protein
MSDENITQPTIKTILERMDGLESRLLERIDGVESRLASRLAAEIDSLRTEMSIRLDRIESETSQTRSHLFALRADFTEFKSQFKQPV